MLASRISTPKLELGSHAPRWVMIWTVQPPSSDVRARAVSVAEAATIATVGTVQAVRRLRAKPDKKFVDCQAAMASS
jgi:hypothetical protein